MFLFSSIVQQSQVNYIFFCLLRFAAPFSATINPLRYPLHGEKNCACSLLCSHSDFRLKDYTRNPSSRARETKQRTERKKCFLSTKRKSFIAWRAGGMHLDDRREEET